MRLMRLGLPAYGHFSQAALSFPPPPPGKPDLHVVFGPNEAGKSTLFAAWLDMLFGFAHQTPYDFLHERRALRIEADLDDGSDSVTALARIKGNRNTLLDATSGQPVADMVLANMLGGLDRDSYTTMFSLDEDTLVRGGEAILAHEGDLGQLLFQATAGLADLGDALRDLRAGADAWFRPRARKNTALLALKEQLGTLATQRKSADLGLAQWTTLKEEAETASTTYQKAMEERSTLAAEHAQLTRDLQALSILGRMLREQELAADLPPPEDLPPEWIAGIAGWQQQETRLAALLPQAREALDLAAEKLAELQPDPVALYHAARLDDLQETYGVIVKSLGDLPKREGERDTLEMQITAVMTELGMAGTAPEDALLPAPLHAELGALLDRASSLAEHRDAAHRELDAARATLAEVEETLHPSSLPDTDSLTELAHLLAELRRQDPLRSFVDAQTRHDMVLAEHQASLAALLPWQGTIAQLAAMRLPDADSLRNLDTRITRAEADLANASAELQRQKVTLARLRARLGEAVQMTPEDLESARSARDRLWLVHLQSLSRPSAESFAQAMSTHDAAQARAIQAARMVERLEALRAEETAVAHAQDSEAQARDRLDALRAQVATFWATIDPSQSPANSVHDLVAWQEARKTALTTAKTLDEAAAALRIRDDQLAKAGCSLMQALPSSSSDPTEQTIAADDYLRLLARAEALRDDAVRLQERGARLRQARQDLGKRQRSFDTACSLLNETHAQVEKLLGGTWIAQDASAAQLRSILQGLSKLAPLQNDRSNLLHRIMRIKDDARKFHQTLAGLAQDMQIDLHAGAWALDDIRHIWAQIRNRLRGALQNEEARQRLLADQAEASDHLRDLTHQQEALTRDTRALRAHFGDISLLQIASALDRNQKARDHSRRLQDIRAELAETLNCVALDPEITRLQELNADTARAQVQTLEQALQAQDAVMRETYARMAAAQHALEGAGADAAAARLAEEYQTLLLQIAEEAREHLGLQAGILAVETALRHYRETHRSSMMDRAGQAFRQLTCGRYSGLATRPEGSKDLLIALEEGGAAKPADTLSKGTAFQLFLALRIAGYHELAGQRGLVPFIADDIMESFDDDRAFAAFGLLAEMGLKGQVIYLTHHAHLCDIARRACPDAQLHDLRSLHGA